MTLDERLEALTQTVELMATLQRDSERHTKDQFAQVARLIAQDAENIRALARIAEAHEHRLDRLEGE